MSDNNDWTWKDYDYLYKNYGVVDLSEIASKLGRTTYSVIIHAERLKLYDLRNFTPEEIRMARQYGKQLGSALTFFIPGRSVASVEELIKCANSE